jgi:hypothetical protein
MIIFNENINMPFRMFEVAGKMQLVELNTTPKKIVNILESGIETSIKNNLPKRYNNKKVNCIVWENEKPFGMGKFYIVEINPIIEKIKVEFVFGDKDE